MLLQSCAPNRGLDRTVLIHSEVREYGPQGGAAPADSHQRCSSLSLSSLPSDAEEKPWQDCLYSCGEQCRPLDRRRVFCFRIPRSTEANLACTARAISTWSGIVDRGSSRTAREWEPVILATLKGSRTGRLRLSPVRRWTGRPWI